MVKIYKVLTFKNSANQQPSCNDSKNHVSHQIRKIFQKMIEMTDYKTQGEWIKRLSLNKERKISVKSGEKSYHIDHVIIIIIKACHQQGFLYSYLSLLAIAPDKSSWWHPEFTQSWWMLVFAGWSTLVCPWVWVHRKTSLRNLSLLPQQYPACLGWFVRWEVSGHKATVS